MCYEDIKEVQETAYAPYGMTRKEIDAAAEKFATELIMKRIGQNTKDLGTVVESTTP